MLYPLLPVLVAVMQKSPASTFFKAGAISPDTARKPSTVGAKGDLERSLKSGLIVAAGEGRYYVDPEKFRRRARMIYSAWIAVAIVFVALLLIVQPWRDWF